MFAGARKVINRRLSYLAGGSVAAAAVLGGAVVMAPATAHAANECGDPFANGASADTFLCTDATAFSAIVYPATNGSLTLQLQNDVTVTTGGIVITPSGSDAITLNRIPDSSAGAGDPQITSTTGAGISIIRAAGNGNFTVALTDPGMDEDEPMSITGTTAGIHLSNSGSGSISLTTHHGQVTATNGVGVQLGVTGTGNILYRNGADLTGTTGALLIDQGVNATVDNNPLGSMTGTVTFNNTGSTLFSNYSVWRTSGVSFFGSGASTFRNREAGLMIVEGTVTLTGLETFDSLGAIYFGANEDLTGTDGDVDDRLVTTADFNASLNSALAFDFLAGGDEQTSCAATVSADCLDIRGVTVLGKSKVIVNAVPSDGGHAAERIVLVDAQGGLLLKDYFLLSPLSPGYFTDSNGETGINAGAFAYALRADEENDQLYLTGDLGPLPVQLAHIPEAVRTAWDLTADAWLDRQFDLRRGDDAKGGLWLRGVSGFTSNTETQETGLFIFETGYRQNSSTLIGGADFVVAPGLLAGVTASYVTSEVDHRQGEAVHDLKGYAFGGYASWWTNGFFADGLVSYTKLDASSSVFTGESEATAVGAQVEAGYRFAFADDALFLEPLVGLTYVNTDAGEVTLADGSAIVLDKVTSLRGSVGLRLGTDTEVLGLGTRLALTGRAVQEFDGEAALALEAGGESNSFVYDDDRDTLGDLALSVSVFGLAERLSLNLAAGLKFKEDYEAGQFTVGLRYAF